MPANSPILDNLRTRGFRITKIRAALVEILSEERAPLAVTDLTYLLRKKFIPANKTTLYRELEFLQKQNIVHELSFSEDKLRYELAGDHHHHLICMECGKIEDFELSNELEQIESQIEKKKKFMVRRHALEFFGICESCQKRIVPKKLSN